MKLCSKFIVTLVLSSSLISCSLDVTVVDLDSLWDSVWDFSQTSDYEYDENYVEIKDGAARLKPLDLLHSGDDFNRGTHVGSSFDNSVLKISYSNSPQKDIRNILSTKNTNIIGYWKFENSVSDQSIFQQVSSIEGDTNYSPDSIFGESAIEFDGNGDFVAVQHSSSMETNFLTISFWMKTPVVGQSDQLVTKDNSSGGRSWQFLTQGAGRVQFIIFDNNSSNLSAFSLQRVDDNQWHHIVGVYDGTNITVYVDGISGDPVLFPGILRQGQSSNLFFGRSENASPGYFEGKLDEVVIWREALTSSEIKKVYEEQKPYNTELSYRWTPKYDNIVGYWKMDGNWQDSSGNNHHGVANGDVTFSTDTKVGSQSGAFDGAGDCVSINDTNVLDITSEITISTWVRSVNYSVDQVLVRKENAYILYFFPMANGEPEGLQGYFYGLSDPRIGYSDVNFESNRWYHVATTFDSSTIKLYVDGTEVVSQPSTGTIDTSVNDLYIGTREGCSLYPLNGYIDDTSIWNRALSANDLALIYNRQKQKYAGHYDSKVINLGNTTSIWPDLSWSTSLPFGKELVGDFDNDGNPDSESSSDYSSLSGDLSEDLIAHWELNEVTASSGSQNDFRESLGQHHGEDTGGTLFGNIGQLGRSPEFKGTSAISSGDVPIGNLTKLTASFWINPSDSLDSFASIISKYTSALDRVEISQGPGSQPGSLAVIIQGVNYAYTQAGVLKDGVWTHVVAEYDGSITTSTERVKIYIDGTPQILTIVGTLPATTGNTSANLYFGGRSDDSNYFSGRLDEVSLWSRVLTSSEIQQLYRRGANRIKFQVKSCVDSTCECKSFNTSPAGSATDCDGDGIANALDYDDIHKSSFIGPGGDGTTYYSELFNRNGTDLAFNCGLNTSDSNSNVCAGDEITLNAGPRPTGPTFNYDDFPLAARPDPNPFFQYRVYMEADENTACGGEPCLPELTSVNLNSSGTPKYYGALQVVKPIKPINYRRIASITIDASACATFQLSPDDSNYHYWDGDSWEVATDSSHTSSKTDVQDHILAYANKVGPGNFYIKGFLSTNSNQTSPCEINDIDLNYSNKD